MNLNRKQGRWILGGFMAALLAIIFFTNWPATILQLPLTVHESARTSDVIIVLGAGARKHGDPLPPQAKERVQEGITILMRGYAPSMIASGGLSRQAGYVEAELMKNYAVSLGLPADKIIEEPNSINTWENATNSLAIMRQHNWHTALIVTSPYHTWRACMMFRHQHANVRCVSAPLNSIPTNTLYERLTDLRSVVREYGAIILALFQGRL